MYTCSGYSTALLVAGLANAAEVYNKDGNKLDLYGKWMACTNFGKDDTYATNMEQSYIRFGFKGETQITGQLTGYGQWEYNVQANNSEDGDDFASDNKIQSGLCRLEIQRLRFV